MAQRAPRTAYSRPLACRSACARRSVGSREEFAVRSTEHPVAGARTRTGDRSGVERSAGARWRLSAAVQRRPDADGFRRDAGERDFHVARSTAELRLAGALWE